MNRTELQSILDFEQRRLGEVIRAFPLDEKKAYANWLAQTYYFVCHSTRLLALAASRFDRAKNSLHLRFIEHLQEEKNHEFLALKDLQQLGFSIDGFPELLETQAFYQTQYYWIEHVHPIAFFGYILALEACAIASGTRFYETARKLYGDRCSVFLKVHTKEDVDHLESALKHLEALSPEDRTIVIDNMRLSGHLYAEMFRKMTAIASSAQAGKAA